MKATVVSLFFLVQAQAFAPPAYQSIAVRNDSIKLRSLRMFWRKRFLGGKRKDAAENGVNQLDEVTTEGLSLELDESLLTEMNGHSQVMLGHKDGPSAAIKETGMLEDLTAASTSVVTLEIEGESLDKRFSLASIEDQTLNKLEQEFRDMLIDFSQFTKQDIRAVRNPRMRALFEGVAASYSLPEVYRAFEVLFDDYVPLRVAGRLIYGKLKQVMVESQLERQKEMEAVAASTGMTMEDIEASRTAFFKMVVHQDDKATEMTIDQLVDLGLAETTVEVLGFENFDEFVQVLEPKASQRVGFCELMVALQSCPVDSPGPECNPATVLQEIASRLESKELSHSGSIDLKRNEKYDGMVDKFLQWKDLVPEGDGRRLDILRGCFVGAGSKEIVEALRIVYIDYSALRMSGDLIFGIMAALVGRRR